MSIMIEALKRAGVVDEDRIAEVHARAEHEREQIERLERDAQEALGDLKDLKVKRDTIERELEELIPRAEKFIANGHRSSYWRDVLKVHVARHDEAERAFQEKAVEVEALCDAIEAITGVPRPS